ncbi:MAG: UDP-N-acetylmuramate dehydrogenase [Betaproteobacteria bacterium]|nr:UDP-N-acetylmuramate dehydrogenase [Betaproteobacteria bacterium]MDE2131520.1 UDP-N-acetylmuramate dehydrogenase [Betaproteobacteria bacterium]MDE2211473.1 UDP-N-acetylmuramate dehydrogenase [Betaproteobacteria bacterium]
MSWIAPGELRRNEPMSRHVSWRAGGLAAQCYVPKNREDLVDFVRSRAAGEKLHVVGLGSNLLVRDGGLDATVVLTHGALRSSAVAGTEARGTVLEVEAGVPAPKVARMAARLGLAGAEFLAGIPGTMGGALAMNAGCYGAETWDYVVSVTTLDRSGRIRVRTPADYDIGYRHVVLRGAGEAAGAWPEGRAPLEPDGEWFLSARLAFPEGSSENALQRIRELLARRVASQPLGQPNAGSVFRNPAGDHAARLIESCGLKGEREGGAEVSRKHANFIVNRGGASARDIETLIRKIQERVLRECGVSLVTEVRIVGKPLEVKETAQ